MNLLFCELLYPQSHARSNSFYIECLSELNCNLFVMSPPDLYDLANVNINYVPVEKYPMDNGKISYRVNTLKYINRILRTVKRHKIDKIILASADYITLSFLVSRLSCRTELFLIHHAEIDSLIHNNIKKFIFGYYKDRIRHLVFEPFIKEMLQKKLNIDEKHIDVMPHSLNSNVEFIAEKSSIPDIDLVGLSNSNSETIISDFIQEAKLNNTFAKNKIHIVLKSKVINFDDGYLKVINGYLSDDEYNQMIARAKYIFIPFPDDFGYRESGTLMDALSNKKLVIASDIRLIRVYKQNYPNICYIYKGVSSVIDILKRNTNECNIYEDEFSKFSFYHSPSNYKKVMMEVLNIKNGE